MTARQGGDRREHTLIVLSSSRLLWGSSQPPEKAEGTRAHGSSQPSPNSKSARVPDNQRPPHSPEPAEISARLQPALAQLACPASALPPTKPQSRLWPTLSRRRLCHPTEPRCFPVRPCVVWCAPSSPFQEAVSVFVILPYLISPECSFEHSPDGQPPRAGPRGRWAAESTHRCPSTGHV